MLMVPNIELDRHRFNHLLLFVIAKLTAQRRWPSPSQALSNGPDTGLALTTISRLGPAGCTELGDVRPYASRRTIRRTLNGWGSIPR